VMSRTACSMIFLSETASPTPMLSVILERRGTAIALQANFACSAGRTLSLYCLCRLAIALYSAIQHFAVGFEEAHLLVADGLDADAVALLGFRIPQHHVGRLDRHFLIDDAAGDAGVRVRLLVLLGDVDAL